MQNALVVVTGARGTGKTTLAATYMPPSRLKEVYYVDDEYSANHIVAQLAEHGLEFGRYVNVQDRFADLPAGEDLLGRIAAGDLPWVTREERNALAAFYEWFIADLAENLTPGTYKQLVVDTIQRLEAGMAAWVEKNKKVTGWSTKAYGRMWNEGVYPLYENILAGAYQRGVEVVTFTSHLRTPWVDDKPVAGKVAPAGKVLLYRLSQLFLWTVNEPRNPSGAPAALVLKERIGKLEPGEGSSWLIRRALPRRLPVATWDAINDYQIEPANLQNPREGEVPSRAEEEMMSELLSDAQMRLMILAAEQELAETQTRQSEVSAFTPPAPQPATDETDMERARKLVAEESISLPEAIKRVRGEVF